MKARVHITLKPAVLDPQGKAIAHALTGLGFDGVQDVRQGKYIEIELTPGDPKQAEAKIKAMCERLLANPVVENYTIEMSV
jgi:phosphoribosylformylglycinamidine synthase PurS subunit